MVVTFNFFSHVILILIKIVPILFSLVTGRILHAGLLNFSGLLIVGIPVFDLFMNLSAIVIVLIGGLVITCKGAVEVGPVVS